MRVGASCTSVSPTIPPRVDGATAPRVVPVERRPRYLVRDRDSAFHAWATTTLAMDIHEVVTAARSPWQNASVERVIGSIRRDCLDHVIVWNERGLRRVLTAYVAYCSSSRTHLSL